MPFRTQLAVITIVLLLVAVGAVFLSISINIEIKNIDGMAYLQYNDYICELLDENGRPEVYNSNIEDNHEFIVRMAVNGVTIYDQKTNKYYLKLDTPEREVQTVSIMYKPQDK